MLHTTKWVGAITDMWLHWVLVDIYATRKDIYVTREDIYITRETLNQVKNCILVLINESIELLTVQCTLGCNNQRRRFSKHNIWHPQGVDWLLQFILERLNVTKIALTLWPDPEISDPHIHPPRWHCPAWIVMCTSVAIDGMFCSHSLWVWGTHSCM